MHPIGRSLRSLAALAFAIACCGRSAQAALAGAEVYSEACATCHGKDGRGSPEGSAITVQLPDFTDCTVSTSETTANWEGLIRYGGTFLGVSDQMPAFGAALSDDEIRAVAEYVRGFCKDPRYPVGDLNFPRPLFVEKAYPEDEGVVSFDYQSGLGGLRASWEAALEKRIGARGQVEISVPATYAAPDKGSSSSGIGDLGLSYKQVLLADPGWNSIVSARLALTLPTGKTDNDIGSGTTVFAPQLLAGQALGSFVLQTEIAAEVPTDAARADRQMLYALALQYRLGPYKKNVVAGVELQQTQALDSDVHAATVLGPTLYLPLSRRGHVALGVGAQLPVAGTRPYDWLFGSFLLWDFADGPIWAW
ncbi:MAG: c-type cytochrome [Gemmatimonadales bacterium]